MASFKLILSLLVVFVVFARAEVEDSYEESKEEDETSSSDVVVLTDKNFDIENGGFQYSLVMFHAPWCGYCKELSPHFAKAATILKENKRRQVALVKVDCMGAGQETCETFNVRGYPNLKVFRDGKWLEDYKGTRETDGIVKFMNEILDELESRPKSAAKVEL